MKITWNFADGSTSEVEVNEELGEIILDSRRQEENLERKERYHCTSYDAFEYESEELAGDDTPETITEQEFDNERIDHALSELSEIQRKRLLMLAAGLSVRELARREGKEIKTVRESIAAARKKFLKKF